MLDMSGILGTWSAPMWIGIVFTFAIHLDRFNDRTVRPIPTAGYIWEPEM